MPRRVSLKGKGADIFFGDYTPEAGSPAGPKPEASAPPPAAPEPSAERGAPSGAPEPKGRASTRARVHARTQADIGARVRTAMRDELHKKLQLKQRLTSSTFRFRPEELDRLDRIVGELEQGNGQRPSKNDLVRLGLLWLLADYEEHRDGSVLAQVLTRM